MFSHRVIGPSGKSQTHVLGSMRQVFCSQRCMIQVYR